MSGTLTPLQMRVLESLALISPRWTLSGGGALAGFHLRHRTTRDLDLFWHGLRELANLGDAVKQRLEQAGLTVTVLQRSTSFMRLSAGGDGQQVVIDMVAEPIPFCDAPVSVRIGSETILVDTPQEILANKLGALLHRAELRDLIDLRALLASGCDLRRGLADAGRKDGGFSPLTVGWSLSGFQVMPRAEAARLSEEDGRDLDAFRLRLMSEIAALAKP